VQVLILVLMPDKSLSTKGALSKIHNLQLCINTNTNTNPGASTSANNNTTTRGGQNPHSAVVH
jgi:hypothetical protein